MTVALADFALKLIQSLKLLLLRKRIIKKVFDLTDNLLFLCFIKQAVLFGLEFFFEDLSRFVKAKSGCGHDLLMVPIIVSAIGFDMT